MTQPTAPPTDEELAEIQTAVAAYRRHSPTGFACCTAHPVADAGAMLLEEIRRLKGQRKFLLDQLARKDARSGDGDKALREFLGGEPTPLTEQRLAHWKRRALQAEAVVHFALWMRPLGPHWSGREPETADQLCTRFRAHVEDRYPEQITRYGHRRIEVLELAELCGCREDVDDWDEFHGESGENGHALCSKKVLGHVCDSCKDEEGEGPGWLPYAVEWPCPPIAALDQPAAPAPPVAPPVTLQPSEAPVEGETAARAPTGRVGDSPPAREPFVDDRRNCIACACWMSSHIRDGQEIRCAFCGCSDPLAEDPPPAEDFTGTQPCGHDDYHDPHPWHERPNLWCPGIGYDDDQAAAEETAQ